MTLILCLLQGFLSLFSLVRFTQISTVNPLTFLSFVVLVFLYYQFTKNHVACKIAPSDKTCSFIVSLLFTCIAIFSQQDILLVNTQNLVEKISVLFFSAIGLFLILYYFLLWIFMSTTEATITQNLYPNPALPGITFFGCILVWGLYFLYFYPGILPSSTILEYQQINGAIPFMDQPSLIHAVLLDKILKLLAVFSLSTVDSIAVLTFLQLVFLAFIAAYVVRTLQLAHIHTVLCTLCILFYLLPYHAIMACTLSNEILFAANLTGYLAVITRLFLKSDRKQYTKAKWFSILFCYFVFGFMTCTLSRTGLVVFLLSLPFILFSLREKWKVTIPVSAAILLFVFFLKFPFFQVYEIGNPSWLDCLHPLLQAVFQPDSETSVGTLLYSYLKECSSIIYPETNPLLCYVGIAPNEYMIETSSVIHYPAVLVDTLLTMHTWIPIYGLFWSCGNLFWVLMVSIFLCIRNQKRENIVLALPVFFVFLASFILSTGTILFHHMYSIFLALPLFFFLSFIDAESEY